MIREQDLSRHLKRTRPVRVVNELYRQGAHVNVAKFYTDELCEVGFDTDRVDRETFDKLTPEERKQTASDLYEGLKKLARSGNIVTEAMFLSSRMWPRQQRSETARNYFARLDKPHFDLLLREYFSPYLHQEQQFSSVLSLGCGLDLEAQTIRQYLAPVGVQPIHLGIDFDSAKIQDASKLNPSEANYHYIEGDANSQDTRDKLLSLVGVDYQFDLMVARHFPVWKHGDLWKRTLEGYAPYLKIGGLLLMTLYYDPEFEEVTSQGIPTVYQVATCERNKTRSFNRRVDIETIFGGFAGVLDSSNQSPYDNDPYQLWLNNMCRDKFVILAQKS
jgi:SAM-dependent methyltransferase